MRQLRKLIEEERVRLEADRRMLIWLLEEVPPTFVKRMEGIKFSIRAGKAMLQCWETELFELEAEL